jgi:hypothetical protein
MKIRFIIPAIIAATLVCAAALTAPALRAEPAHPTVSEVTSVAYMLNFRSGMLANPAKTVSTYAVGAARGQFATIDQQMAKSGSGPLGWRYLLATSVFTAAGLNEPRALIVFYNPWIDTAVFTVWETQRNGRRIVDIDWVPGDLVRQANAEIDPKPLWLRGAGYRPEALSQAVVTTVKAIETRFGDPKQINSWRDTLGIKDARSYNAMVPPILAMRLYEAQLRIKALAVPAAGEDPKLTPLRTAVAALIKTVGSEGFAKPLAEAKDTSQPMKQLLTKINRKTMGGLAPVAFVADEGYATVFLASTQTADFALSARYVERVSGYSLQQLEFIPYAAIYQASAGQAVR